MVLDFNKVFVHSKAILNLECYSPESRWTVVEFQGKSYTAVKVEQPTTFATFVYAAYDYAGGKWILKDYSLKKTQLDGGPQHQ